MLSRPASRAFCRVRASLSAACTRPWIVRVDKIGGIAWAGSLGGIGVREAGSSSSSTRWKTRQGKDSFAREARVQGLKSRAAFKLLEIDAKYKVFKKGQTVVDLGYAPGSWSQVAVERTKSMGRIIGIDIIPAQPPKGVSTIQGNFLSKGVQEEVKRFLSDPARGRPTRQLFDVHDDGPTMSISEGDRSYIDLERHADDAEVAGGDGGEMKWGMRRTSTRKERENEGKTVDVVLSDMSAPWEQTTGFWKRSLSDPYYRMMNTTGIPFRDHAGSMDLCHAALQFARDTLRVGGTFICKFYQGAEDKELERQLRAMFKAVHREKPESSRSESKEAYFVALRKKPDTVKELEKEGTTDSDLESAPEVEELTPEVTSKK